MSQVQPNPTMQELLGVAQAARILGVSPARVHQLCASGDLSFVRIGNGTRAIYAESVHALAEKRRLDAEQREARKLANLQAAQKRAAARHRARRVEAARRK